MGTRYSTMTPASKTKLTSLARELLLGRNLGFLATINPDGSPQVTPVWIDTTDGKYILVNTVLGRIKQKNTRRVPEVGIAVVDQRNPYRMVTIRGRVIEQIAGSIAEDHVDKLTRKYMGLEVSVSSTGRTTGHLEDRAFAGFRNGMKLIEL